MESRIMDFPSPRGVHVPEAYYVNDQDDPYRRPPSRLNRYSRTTPHTPRIRDVTWISSPDPAAPQTPHAAPSPWPPPQHVPPTSPAPRPPSAIPPSPAPTVGEHMNLDDFAFVQDNFVDPYRRPQRPGLLKSFWKGLRKLSGYHPSPSFPMPRPSSYVDHAIGIPIPVPSEATQYVNPTPSETSETEEHRIASPYASPYARQASVSSMPAPIPGSLRASPVPAPSMPIAPPITVISPSVSPSPPPRANSIRSVRMPTPGPVKRNLSVGMPEPVDSTEEASQTLHEHIPARPLPVPTAIPVTRSDDELEFPLPQKDSGILAPPTQAISTYAVQAPQVDRSSSKSSLTSTIARFRRFVAELDDLPWTSGTQIADEYIPEQNPRSRMRAKVRQGADPSWYNPRPEIVARPEHWSEWDIWAKQSTAALWDGTVFGNGRVGWAGVGVGGGLGHGPGPGPGLLGQPVYPHGYGPAQPAFAYQTGYPPPGPEQGHVPVIL